MLPYVQNLPAFFPDSDVDSLITRNVIFDFLIPVFHIGFRSTEAFWASVPEAAINENCNLPSWQYEIDSKSCDFEMFDEPETTPLKIIPDQSLRDCVFGSYSGHYVAARFFRKLIRHMIV